MNRLARDETAEPVSRDQILRHARGQGNVHFPCSADHEQDWQPYPVDPYSAICDIVQRAPSAVCTVCTATNILKQRMDQPGKVTNPARGQLSRGK